MRSSAENAQEQSINPKHRFVSDTIQRMTADQSLPSIQENLKDAKGWYAEFNKQGGITPGCWLHLRDKIKEYTLNQQPLATEIKDILDRVTSIYGRISEYESTGKGNMVENLAASASLIEKLTEWCNSSDRTPNDLALMKTFLIVQKTMEQRSLSMSRFEKMAVKGMGLEEGAEEIQRKFGALGEAVTAKIIALDPSQQSKTIEQHLSTDLSTLHQATFKSKTDTSNPFETIKVHLKEQYSNFNELHALKYMQDVLKANREKTVGREYFSDLIGGDSLGEGYERERCFNIIISALGESEKQEWQERVTKANTPTYTSQVLYVASTLATPVTWLARMFTSDPLGGVKLFETEDSQNKKDFSALIERRIDAVCSKTAPSNTALKDGLKNAASEKIQELKEKTGLLGQLYGIDEHLAAYIKENNTLSARFGNWLRTYMGYQGPLGALVSEAKNYKNNIKELKEAVLADKPLEIESIYCCKVF